MVKAKTTTVGSDIHVPAAATDNTPTDAIQAKKAALAAAAAAAKPRGPTREDVTSAVTALYAYVANKRNTNPSNALPLLDDDGDDLITLQLTLNTIPRSAHTTAYTIPLLHPIYGPLAGSDASGELCLITKDSIVANMREYLRHNSVGGLTKVFGITELRKDYRQYRDRRQLLAQYQLFLADERIIPLLPNVLGNKFFEKKKQPIPVNLTSSSRTQKERIDNQSQLLQKRLTRARDCTYLYLSAGPCISIRIARMTLSRFDAVDNILSALPYIINKIPGRWSNVQSIYVKTNDSMSMPVYAALLTDIPLYRVNIGEKRQREDEENDNDEEDDDDDEEGDDNDMKNNAMIGTADDDDIIDEDEDEDDDNDVERPISAKPSSTVKQSVLRSKPAGKPLLTEKKDAPKRQQQQQEPVSMPSSKAASSKKAAVTQTNSQSVVATAAKPTKSTETKPSKTVKQAVRTSTRNHSSEKSTKKNDVAITVSGKKRKVNNK